MPRSQQIEEIKQVRQHTERILRLTRGWPFDDWKPSTYHQMSITIRDEENDQEISSFYTWWDPKDLQSLIYSIYDASELPKDFLEKHTIHYGYGPDDLIIDSTLYKLLKKQLESPGPPKKGKSPSSAKVEEYKRLFRQFADLYKLGKGSGGGTNVGRCAKMLGISRTKLDSVIDYCYPYIMDSVYLYEEWERLKEAKKTDEQILEILEIDQDQLNDAIATARSVFKDRKMMLTMYRLGDLRKFIGKIYKGGIGQWYFNPYKPHKRRG